MNKKNYKIYNPKIHDLLNIYFKEFNNLYLTADEAITFIKNNNKLNVKIIFYYHNFGIKPQKKFYILVLIRMVLIIWLINLVCTGMHMLNTGIY